jgi:hypothetical protein
MELNAKEQQFNDILTRVAKSLDIPPSKYKQAVERYGSVGGHLEQAEYDGINGEHHVTCQGSFRLGTVVRPLKDGVESDYDIDLVCKLALEQKPQTVQKARDLKHLVGDELKSHGTYSKLLKNKEGKRCWTLQYAEEDGIGFHMDILPSESETSEKIEILRESGVRSDFAQAAIAITDKDQSNYTWKSSNPNGFADWFEERMKVLPDFDGRVIEQKHLLFESNRSIYASVGDVPNEMIRTPLQQAIQIMKRHRDMRFAGHKWEKEKPISMIISTLAALAYQGEEDVYSTLLNFADRVDQYLHTQLIVKNHYGEWVISNPVNPVTPSNPEGENYADKWNEVGSNRADAFFQWIGWLKEDVEQLLAEKSMLNLSVKFDSLFGSRVVQSAFSDLGLHNRNMRESKKLKMDPGTGVIGVMSAGIKVKDHIFYGGDTPD